VPFDRGADSYVSVEPRSVVPVAWKRGDLGRMVREMKRVARQRGFIVVFDEPRRREKQGDRSDE